MCVTYCSDKYICNYCMVISYKKCYVFVSLCRIINGKRLCKTDFVKKQYCRNLIQNVLSNLIQYFNWNCVSDSCRTNMWVTFWVCHHFLLLSVSGRNNLSTKQLLIVGPSIVCFICGQSATCFVVSSYQINLLLIDIWWNLMRICVVQHNLMRI